MYCQRQQSHVVTVPIAKEVFIHAAYVNITSYLGKKLGRSCCQRHQRYVVTVTIRAQLLFSDVNVTSVFEPVDSVGNVNVNNPMW